MMNDIVSQGYSYVLTPDFLKSQILQFSSFHPVTKLLNVIPQYCEPSVNCIVEFANYYLQSTY